MAEYQKKIQAKGSGFMRPNTQAKSDKAPQWRGLITDLAGKQWEISGWDKEYPEGRKMELKMQEKWVKPEGKPTQPPPSQPAPPCTDPTKAGFPEDDDKIPF